MGGLIPTAKNKVKNKVLESLDLGVTYRCLSESQVPLSVLTEAVSKLRQVKLSGKNPGKVLVTKILRRIWTTQKMFEDRVDMSGAMVTRVEEDVVVDAIVKVKKFGMDFTFLDDSE